MAFGGAAVVVLAALTTVAFFASGNPLEGAPGYIIIALALSGWVAAVVGSIRLMDIMPKLLDHPNPPQPATISRARGVYAQLSIGATISLAVAVASAI